MSDPLVPERELRFLLQEWLDVAALCRRARYAEHGPETFDAVLETARAIALRDFLSHNRKADQQEPRLTGGRVELIPEVKAALDAFNEAGFGAALFDQADGGLQLPWSVTQACYALFQGANVASFAYPFLTIAAANLLDAFATEEQRRRYLRHLVSGRFFGTMCLSEPQAGSSLSDIRTRARPLGDGRYAIRGGKMWISGGEHELAENIVHLVLARIEGAPSGVKGISLFLVPRFRLDAAGRPAEANDVTLAGLNHKMGYRGTVNTVLSFGDKEGCIGELVGEPHQGLACMFHMMNEARIGVGMSAAALADVGYRTSLAYARERRQGRPLEGRDPTAPQVAIIEHADVRRMLLAQKAISEGSLALGLRCARLVDEQRTAEDEEARRRATLLLDILTPVMKAWCSHYGLIANDLAIQVLGGYGYTRDFPAEQLYRDNRLNPIHEGTNGIQAIDLLGRKVSMAGGAAFHLLMAEIRGAVDKAAGLTGLEEESEQLARALSRVEATTARLLSPEAGQDRDARLANASAYLEMTGHLVIAWIWLSQASVAIRALATAGSLDLDYYRGKLQACRYFFRWELPRIEQWAALLERFDDTPLAMRDAWF